MPDAAPASPAATGATAAAETGLRTGEVLRLALRELLRTLLIAVAGAAAGWAVDHALAGLCIALALCFLNHLRRLAQLRAWLERRKSSELPEAGGAWGEVFDRLLDMQRRHRRKKKRLSAMLSEYQASTAALPDGAVVLGAQGDIAWFNQAAQALLGLRSGADIGVRIPNLIRHPLFAGYFTDGDYRQAVEVPSPLNAGGILSLRIIPYGSSQRLLIVRDVSDLRRLETARRDFVANASHELRTPLTVLRGYLEMMEAEAQGRGALDNWRTPIVEMRAQASRMEALVRDLLRLARLESDVPAQREVLDVPALLRRVLSEARALSQERHTFETAIDEDLLLLGDEADMQSIFTNLAANAVRYTPAGGRIRIAWQADAAGALFSVTDTGIGIAEKDLPRLTERFYRVDVGRSRASGGTGLGLSIVKHALERHDGRLEIRSELGKGSSFVCRFPAWRLRPRAQAGAEPDSDAA